MFNKLLTKWFGEKVKWAIATKIYYGRKTQAEFVFNKDRSNKDITEFLDGNGYNVKHVYTTRTKVIHPPKLDTYHQKQPEITLETWDD